MAIEPGSTMTLTQQRMRCTVWMRRDQEEPRGTGTSEET